MKENLPPVKEKQNMGPGAYRHDPQGRAVQGRAVQGYVPQGDVSQRRASQDHVPQDRLDDAFFYARQALLPEGFRDGLFPETAVQADMINRLLTLFDAYGYDRVRPPIAEYEESLLAGVGAAKAARVFRLMDPDSHRMMGLRADITPQISRIAATRLAHHPRPLRLSYAGTVLEVKADHRRQSRDYMQAGFELIGALSLEAELEVIALAYEGLTQLGIKDLSLDVTLPPLADILIAEGKLDYAAEQIYQGMASRDASNFAALPLRYKQIFDVMIDASGPAAKALPKLEQLALTGAAGKLVARLNRLVERLQADTALYVTIDPCERAGFDYKTGLGFAFFCKQSYSELGRGGRYTITHPNGYAEEAVGFSAYLDCLMDVTEKPVQALKLYLPYGSAFDFQNKEQQDERAGWRFIRGLDATVAPEEEAKRLGCTHILLEGKPVAL